MFAILSFFLHALKPSPLFAWEPPPVSEKVFQYIKGEFGAKADKRFRNLVDLIHENYQLPIAKKLTLVNDTMNNLPWIADAVHWKKADYWATTIETISTFGGDCEDIAIAKWIVLNMMGVTNDHLRLAYVVVKETGEKHIVLLYVANPQMSPDKWDVSVLDNIVPEVKKASQRPDLIAVFITDADDNIVLVADDGKQRTIKGSYQHRTMRKLDNLKKIIRENRLKIKELNDGKALWPENP